MFQGPGPCPWPEQRHPLSTGDSGGGLRFSAAGALLSLALRPISPGPPYSIGKDINPQCSFLWGFRGVADLAATVTLIEMLLHLSVDLSVEFAVLMFSP